MKAACLIGLVALALGTARLNAQSAADPFTRGARLNYGIIKSFVTRAAVKMPDDNYAFRPTPEVRSFGQLIGHVADANYRLCSVLAGQNPPMDAGIERTKATKADIIKALADSFDYCDKQYAAMTDAAGAPVVEFDAGGEGARVPIRMPRLTVLAFHVQHAFEHYGNIVTYMRLKGIVPPSSEPRTQ